MKQRSEKNARNRGNSQPTERGVSASNGSRVVSASPAKLANQALPEQLMECICDKQNLNTAYKRVRSNKGSPGIDGMSVEQASDWIKNHKESLIESLLDGSYRPQPVRRVRIPKPGGGERELGIPTVIDRIVQQAILQVLQPKFDPHFSDNSYGFRPGRSAHGALRRAQEFIAGGDRFVVDLDVEKFFDRVNHDILMSRLAMRVGDKRLLRIIRRYLAAGIMSDGVVILRHEGTPQGGPLSPLLSNIVLDDLDRELARRGHRFCRYADDCNIYVKSQAAADRVLSSICAWIERHLKLRINRQKSSASPASTRKFLGFIVHGTFFRVAPESFKRLEGKLRRLTRRWAGESMVLRIAQINALNRGWVGYFGSAACKKRLQRIDEWLRHRLRTAKLHELKRSYTRVRFVCAQGLPEHEAWKTFKSGKGLWRLGSTPVASIAMNRKWFDTLGLQSLSQLYSEVSVNRNRRIPQSTSGGVGGR